MSFEFKGVTISEPVLMDVDKMSGHPKLFFQDHPKNPLYIHDCKFFGYEDPVVNRQGVIFSHFNDWVACKTNGIKQMWVRIIDGADNYEIRCFFTKML